jgi:UDP-glucose:(heptosyl)LPS alpha-1,3-glucosyltransferase
LKIALSFPACHRRGGVERIMLECANFLALRGHETHVLATQWDAAALHPGVQTHFVPARTSPPLLRLWSFRRHSNRSLAALPQIESVGAFGVISPPGVLWVQSVHGAWLEISAARRGWKGRLKQKLNPVHPYTIYLERKVFGKKGYHHLIALTPQVKDDLMRLYGVPAADITIVPNGFSPEEFNLEVRRQREKVRLQLGIDKDERVVIFVANELERKGFGPLLRAIASLKRTDVHLLAVGRLDASAYAAEIERLGMKKRVHFTGPSSDVAAYYAASDIFALPTQYEAWGLVIVEAMACGLPVVTSALAGAAVAVEPGKTGILLENPDDEVEVARGLAHFLDQDRIDAEAISASVEKFAWNRVLLDYERVLMEHSKP